MEIWEGAMARLETVLDILLDARVHDLDEIERTTGISRDSIKAAVKFMAEFGVVMFDEVSGSVALVLPVRRLIEEDMGVAT